MLLKLGATSTHATLNDNRFETNEASVGGALFIDDASEVRAARSSFIGNVALEGGAIRARDSGRLVCEQCRFVGNQATSGAALALVGPTTGTVSVQHRLSGVISDNNCVADNPLHQFGVVLLTGLCAFRVMCVSCYWSIYIHGCVCFI
jgi:hypothetical protein